MIRRILIEVAVAFAILAPGARSQSTDLDAFSTRLVPVDDSVELEVLDWGGEGPPLVFIAGLGDTAHAWELFAPRLRDSFHVIAITRKGIGASSRPTLGYDSAHRARDIRAVLDSLGLSRVVLVGHSIGGEEITRFAVNYPRVTRGLVYIEAYRNKDTIPGLPFDAPSYPSAASGFHLSPADSASIEGVASWWLREFHYRPTENEIRSVVDFGSDGRVRTLPAPSHSAEVYAASDVPDYQRIDAPALGIFAVNQSAADLFVHLASFDRENLAAANGFFEWERVWQAAQIEMFRSGLRGSRVVELPGATHYVHNTRAAEVEGAMRDFLSTLPN